MKKKMVCLSLFSVFCLGGYLPPAQASSDEYVMTAEELNPGVLEDDALPPDYEDDGLSPDYELEMQDADQPYITDETFPAEEEEGLGVFEELREESPELSGLSHPENQ